MNPEDIPLRDLHLPDVAGWWPLAPGWWVIAMLVAVGAILLLRKTFLAWRANAPRRLALNHLAMIQCDFDDGADAVVLGKELSELTRRAMLAYAARDEVAGLTGDDWLRWLDRGLDEKSFSEGPGKNLESLPYMDPAGVDNDTDVGGLIDAVHTRLKNPLPEVAV